MILPPAGPVATPHRSKLDLPAQRAKIFCRS